MSCKRVGSLVLLVLICFGATMIPASAQHFQQVSGPQMASLSAGRNEVFGLALDSTIWRFVASKKNFVKIPGSFVQVAVGGGTLSQKDEVWGIDSNGQIFKFNYGKKVFDHVPGTLQQIAVGDGNQEKCHPYEVWGVNPIQQIYRYNYCTKFFEQIPGSLVQVATGGGDVWGINSSGQVFQFFVPTESLEQWHTDWPSVSQIAVAANDVWAISASQSLRYDASHLDFVIWDRQFRNYSSISAGGNGVWVLDCTFHIYRFDPGSYDLVQVPGVLTQIAVGSGAGVFGVNSAGQIFRFVRP